MKKIVALCALLLACCTGILKAQTAPHIFNNKELLAINVINNILVTQGNNPFLNISNPFLLNAANDKPVEAAIVNSIETYSATQFKYAMMMDVEVEALSNALLYNFINDWYGTRYRMGGTTKRGIDCSAFTGTLFSSIYYFNLPRTAREQYKVCEKVNKIDLMTGDLVFFNTCGGVSHVGVFLTNNRFVHASSSKGIMISSLDDTYFSKRFIGGGRVNQ